MAASNKFGYDITRWANQTKQKLDTVARKVALDMFSRVVLRSPVDTGRFRGNWQCAIDSVPQGTVDKLDPSGGTAIAGINREVAGFGGGHIIYLVNHLPYAWPLEMGWSKQAPAGMVRITVEEFRPIVEGAVRITRNV